MYTICWGVRKLLITRAERSQLQSAPSCRTQYSCLLLSMTPIRFVRLTNEVVFPSTTRSRDSRSLKHRRLAHLRSTLYRTMHMPWGVHVCFFRFVRNVHRTDVCTIDWVCRHDRLADTRTDGQVVWENLFMLEMTFRGWIDWYRSVSAVDAL